MPHARMSLASRGEGYWIFPTWNNRPCPFFENTAITGRNRSHGRREKDRGEVDARIRNNTA